MSNRTKHVLACGSMVFVSIGLGLPAAAQQRSTISRVPSTMYLPSAPSPTMAQPSASGPGSKVQDISVLPSRKLDLGDAAASKAAAEEKIKAFVAQNAKELGLEGNAAQLVVKDMRETLTGRYVSLEQRLDGVPIIDGHIQMTFSKDGTLQSVARSVVDVPTVAAASVNKAATIEANAAEDIAWKDLGANGQLLEPPQADKAYLNENNVLTLVYVVKLAVSQPFGYWEYRIDANTGRIISKRERSIKEDKSKRALTPAEAAAAAAVWPRPAPADRNVLMQDLQRRANETKQVDKAAAATAAVGKGLIFEPNPVSTLNNTNLKDGDPAAKFDKAYVEVTLEGLTQSGGKLHLQGPLVRIEDFEPGEGGVNRPPSTAVGQWTARRGDNAFNDVMSYYHVQSSIRYLQKLGFQGAADLFPAGIAVDSDGLNGADNSHYVPGSDRLAFGHGCVDDNEDTDVILHELGHAIHTHIDAQWGGGDSGAIGEGFGDYWAMSQRMRMKNGLAVDVAKIFVWDGIDACWGGRRADRANAMYDPARSYDAHEDVGGFASDELWSTPLVSALFELVKAGETHESVDQVVLEGMQGIGQDFTMRTLALATVAKAKALFPGKPHAAVFEKHFRNHKLIN